MKKLPSIKQLQYLVALYDTQHFGKAAEQSFVSQSALSTAIASLEGFFNIALIERDHKTFMFTALGVQVVEAARHLIDELYELTEDVKSSGQPMEGGLRLACIPTISPFILSDIVHGCQELYPKLKLSLSENTTAECLMKLHRGDVDCVLMALPYDVSGFHVMHLLNDPFYLVLHKEMDANVFKMPIHQWPIHSILLLEQEHCLSKHTMLACNIQDKEKLYSFSASSLHTLVQMVHARLGVTFLPKLAIESGILNGTSCVAIPYEGHRDIGLVWRKTSSRQKTYHLLGEVIKNIFMKKIA